MEKRLQFMDENHSLKNKDFEIVSAVFRGGGSIPPQYTCKGQNVNPPINILNVPSGTQSLTLIMHDPDAVSGDFLHWLMWDIPPSTESIAVNSVPIGAVQGLNGANQTGYTGPCPPKGTGVHRYIFDFYALDTVLNLTTNSKIEDVIKAQKGHVLNHYALTGTFAAEG
jgi:Raf kinase inhibitor-like YbhB/YbcL family protein